VLAFWHFGDAHWAHYSSLGAGRPAGKVRTLIIQDLD